MKKIEATIRNQELLYIETTTGPASQQTLWDSSASHWSSL